MMSAPERRASPELPPSTTHLTGILIMLQERLAALEDAAQPYIDSGYIVMSQTDSSLTLVRPRPRFSVILFIVMLIVFWPMAIIYSAVNRSKRDKAVCLRITSRGEIEATGDVLNGEKRGVSFAVLLIVIIAASTLTAAALILLRR